MRNITNYIVSKKTYLKIMKDVSDILAKRLKVLKPPFSRDLVSDFSFFMEFVQTNPLISRFNVSCTTHIILLAS